MDLPGGKRACCEAGRGEARHGGAAPSRDHEGFAIDGVVDLRRLLPGDDEDPHGRFGPRAVDYLAGLKENVIMGRLIPGGTGAAAYKAMEFESDAPIVIEFRPCLNRSRNFRRKRKRGDNGSNDPRDVNCKKFVDSARIYCYKYQFILLR